MSKFQITGNWQESRAKNISDNKDKAMFDNQPRENVGFNCVERVYAQKNNI